MDHIDSGLLSACLANGEKITGLTHLGQAVHGGRLLLTIAGLESTFGKRRLFVKMEPGYAPGGHYYKTSEEVRAKWYQYGCLAASSFGSFQLMFISARELGFTGHPIDLQGDEMCAFWATKLITDRIIKRQGATTLEQVLDAYNTGSWKDAIRPIDYVNKGIELYRNLDSI